MKAKHKARIEQKLAEYEGDYQKSLDMLMGYAGTYRYDEELFRKIAALFYETRNVPRAGLYWMMTLERSPQAVEAIEAAVLAFGKNLPEKVPLNLPANQLPEDVLTALCEVLNGAGILNPRASLKKTGHKEDDWILKGIGVACLLIVLGIAILAIAGLVFIVMLLMGYQLAR